MLRKQSENTYDLLHGALRPSRRRSCCLRCAVTGTLKQAAPCSSANASSSADLSSLLDIRSALAECGSFYGNGHAWCHGRVSYSLSPGKTNAARLTVKEDFFFKQKTTTTSWGLETGQAQCWATSFSPGPSNPSFIWALNLTIHHSSTHIRSTIYEITGLVFKRYS